MSCKVGRPIRDTEELVIGEEYLFDSPTKLFNSELVLPIVATFLGKTGKVFMGEEELSLNVCGLTQYFDHMCVTLGEITIHSLEDEKRENRIDK